MELFDYDPQTGIRTLWMYDEETGKGALRREQDVQWAVDLATEIRNSGAMDRRLEDDYMRLYAVIPPGVELELRSKGIDIYKPENTRLLLETINRDYPLLKTTNRTHVANR